MKNTNRVELKGRLGKDPETAFTSGGRAKCAFSIATDDSYKDKSGEWKQVSDWHNVVIWGKLAEVVGQFVKKGDLISLVGKLKTRSWEDTGIKKYITEVVADDVDLIQAWPKADTPQGEPETRTDLPF